jgi:hypothetical protein
MIDKDEQHLEVFEGDYKQFHIFMEIGEDQLTSKFAQIGQIDR